MSRVRRVRGLVVMLACIPATLSCGGDGGSSATAPKAPPLTPAVLAIDITTPNADDGALLLTVVGPGIDSVTSASYALSVGPASAATRVLVYGNITTGVLARVHIRDVQRQGEYTVRMDQVAARGSFVQRSTEPYALVLRRE